MKKYPVLILCFIFLKTFAFSNTNLHAGNDTITPRHKVTLREAHVGDLEIDTKLLDSYGPLPENVRQFYFDARAVFSANPEADFSNPEIVEAAKKHHVPLMGGPLLGNLRKDGVVIWVRSSTPGPLIVKVKKSGGNNENNQKFLKAYLDHQARR